MQTTSTQLRSPTSELVSLLVLLSALVGVYFPVLVKLWGDWMENDNYSHGFFIPLISLYMAWSQRDVLRTLSRKPANWGLLFVLLGLGQLYVARVGSEFFLQRTSLIPLLLGIILFLYGTAWCRKLLLPIFYLIFMIPLPAIIWNKIAFPMQLFSSAVTEQVIHWLGIPIFREGNVLHLAQTTLEVVDACSGLRSLTTMFALSAALAWFAGYGTWKKWLLFLAAAPIAVFANVVRLSLTAFLASRYGEKMAQGFLHEFSGIMTFILGLLLLAVVHSLLQDRKKA